MIDPITIGLAFTAAEQAVAGIKRAIALGKEVHEIVGDLTSFFKHRGEIQSASIEVQKKAEDPNSDQDLMMLSLDIAMKEKQLRQHEEDLKNMFIYELDQSDVWFRAEKIRQDMMLKHQDAIKAQKEKEREERLQAKLARARKQKERAEMMYNLEIIAGVVIGAAIVIVATYLGWQFLSQY